MKKEDLYKPIAENDINVYEINDIDELRRRLSQNICWVSNLHSHLNGYNRDAIRLKGEIRDLKYKQRDIPRKDQEIVKLKNRIIDLEKSLKQEKPVLFGLYEHSSRSYYEGGGDDWTNLVAIDTSREALRERWNNDIQRRLDEVKGQHESYKRYIPPKLMDHEDKTNWAGSTGGGCASVSYRLEIKPIEDRLD